MVMRNINSRIRLNGFSPKEIMFKRDMVSNNEIDVQQQAIKESVQVNRKKASLRANKSKERYLTRSSSQQFRIGHLVFLRNAVDKNTPRSLYIVEEKLEENDLTFYLIRKLQST